MRPSTKTIEVVDDEVIEVKVQSGNVYIITKKGYILKQLEDLVTFEYVDEII